MVSETYFKIYCVVRLQRHTQCRVLNIRLPQNLSIAENLLCKETLSLSSNSTLFSLARNGALDALVLSISIRFGLLVYGALHEFFQLRQQTSCLPLYRPPH